MRIDEYLAAYESYRDAVITAGQIMKETPARRDEMNGIMVYEEFAKEYERKKNILSHATKRLQNAICAIPNAKYSSYLMFRYMYCMTNEEIAERFNYCLRQVYRISIAAKKELYIKLLREMPKAKRWHTGHRYRTAYRRRGEKTLRKYGPKARKRRAVAGKSRLLNAE